jgi:hypothetical protein
MNYPQEDYHVPDLNLCTARTVYLGSRLAPGTPGSSGSNQTLGTRQAMSQKGGFRPVRDRGAMARMRKYRTFPHPANGPS